MADLDDRGQIILVAAFALGVIFIALAVVVNAAIYTENLATRREAASGGDALDYRYEVEQNIGRVIEYINSEADSGTDFTRAAKTNITDISLQGGRYKARVGRIVNVTYKSKDIGQKFANSSGTYYDGSSSNWTVVRDVDRIRNFVLNVSSLSASQSDPFNVSVVASPSGPYWNMSIYEGATGNITVSVNNSAVGHEASCERNVSQTFTIDVTGGEIAGEPCHALTVSNGYSMWFASNISGDYKIKFNNSDEITGGYEGIVMGSPTTASVDKGDVIYSLTVRYRYHTPKLDYETDVRVAPGEPEA